MTPDRLVLAEVIGFSDGYSQIMPLESVNGLSPGDRVIGLRREMTIPVGDSLLGRVIDATGQPMDGQAPLVATDWAPIQKHSPSPLSREAIRDCFITGQRAIDGLLSIGRGQRIGLFAGSGVGKSTLMGEIRRTHNRISTSWLWWESAGARCAPLSKTASARRIGPLHCGCINRRSSASAQNSRRSNGSDACGLVPSAGRPRAVYVR